ncbi:DeoR/GlpR family DNA-binding transcription regulator [Robertmurraya massiliosenegalensis]|uniref:DeoR/GlpR family DNA-binding transcription regulator n=1 Tax=Robertmurraya TaxID=2837507 RepID=UPI0039A71136
MKKNERFNIILEELHKHRTVQVKHLSETFNVSMETIRRDLEELEAEQFLKRVYGGAIAIKKNTQAKNFIERKTVHIKEKQNLARNCVPLVKEGDFIAFDASTTNLTIVQELMNHFKQLTVLTNDLLNAQQMALNTKWTVLLPGGEINNGELFIGGASAIQYIERFQIDTFFMSVSGFTPELGFMDYGFDEYEVKTAMFRNANQIYAVADHHKFGQHAMIKICHAEEVSGVVTDDRIDKETILFFEKNKYPLYY